MYKNLILITLYSFIAFLILGSTVIAALPTNPLSFSPDVTNRINSIVYQGWGFFSKDSRDSMFSAIPIESEETLSWPNNRVSNKFGISRRGRSQGIELGAITAKVSSNDYIYCEDGINECLENAPIKQFENLRLNPTICGTWALIYREPVPWSWGRELNSVEMPSKVVKVDVKCSIN